MLGALLIVVVIQAAAIVALLMHLARRRRAERALHESEERFRLVADRAPVMIWTARPDTTLDYLNSTCAEFTGRTLEQLSNEGWLDSVHPEDLDRCLQTYGPAFEARTPFLMEYRVRHADGMYRWLLASGVPKYDALRALLRQSFRQMEPWMLGSTFPVTRHWELEAYYDGQNDTSESPNRHTNALGVVTSFYF